MTGPHRDRLAFAGVLAALLFTGALAWIAIFALGGCWLAAGVTISGGAAVSAGLWWLHTEGDREARAWQRRWRELGRAELPRAAARWRVRRRR